MQLFTPTGEKKDFRGEGCEATLWFPAAGIVAARVKGHVRERLASAIYAEIDAHTTSHQFPGIGFGDFADITDFDWEARMVLVRWNLQHRAAAQRLHLLTSSPTVQLALRIMTIALGDTVVVHENRATLEAAYHAIVRLAP